MSKPRPNTPQDPEPAAEAEGTDADATQAPADPLAEARSERDQWRDKFLRSAAELDNYRKRMRRELGQSRDQGVAELASGLLEVIDNLERALAAIPEADKGQGLGQGVDMVLGQIRTVLGSFGIQPVEAVGQPFDPHFHEAILEVEQPDAAPGTVLEEARRGYVMGERLLRASQVLVAKAPAAPAVDPKAADGGQDPAPPAGEPLDEE